jgi:hypothetical protein
VSRPHLKAHFLTNFLSFEKIKVCLRDHLALCLHVRVYACVSQCVSPLTTFEDLFPIFMKINMYTMTPEADSTCH